MDSSTKMIIKIPVNENDINDILTVIFIIRLFSTSAFRVPKGRIMFWLLICASTWWYYLPSLISRCWILGCFTK